LFGIITISSVRHRLLF